MITRRQVLVSAGAMAVTSVLVRQGWAQAQNHQVKMLNKGAKGAMVFEPNFVKANVGDSITFIPADKSHNAQSIKGMVPEGATEFNGKLNEEITVTIDKEGVWGVKCTPHYGMGMVMLVLAGSPVNLEAAKAVKHPGKAKKTFEALLAEIPAA